MLACNPANAAPQRLGHIVHIFLHVQTGPVIMEGAAICDLGVPRIVIVKQHGKEITVNKVGHQTRIRYALIYWACLRRAA